MGGHIMRVCASVVSARAAAGTGAGGNGRGGNGGSSSGARGKGNKTKRSSSSSSSGANSKAATKGKGSGKAAGASSKASSGSASQQQKQQQQQRQQVAIDPPVNRTIREGKFDALVFDDSSKGTDVFAMDAPHVPPAATTVDDRLAYERKGHVCIRDVLTDDEARNMSIELVKETKHRTLLAYKHRVSVLCPPGAVDLDAITTESQAMDAIARYSEEEVGFLQTFNIHRDGAGDGEGTGATSEGVAECAKYILSRRLARIAAELLGADEEEGDRVRLYQSCVFVKPPGFGETNWHSDANMVPLDTNRFITLWLPLRPLEEDDAALVFASGSHRDFSLPYWHTLEGMEDLESRGYDIESYAPLNLGDLTAHAGWCLHWSPPQPDDCPSRHALSVCYFLDGARRLTGEEGHLRQVPHEEDEWSYGDWLADVKAGEVARHPALPVVYP